MGAEHLASVLPGYLRATEGLQVVAKWSGK